MKADLNNPLLLKIAQELLAKLCWTGPSANKPAILQFKNDNKPSESAS